MLLMLGGLGLGAGPPHAHRAARPADTIGAYAPPPPASKPDGSQLYPATPSTKPIPGSPLRVVVRPSGSYTVYRNNIQQFFGQYAEGVYLWVNGVVWGPETVPAGRVVNRYTRISSVLTGSGSAADPWVVTNVLGVGSPGLTSAPSPT